RIQARPSAVCRDSGAVLTTERKTQGWDTRREQSARVRPDRLVYNKRFAFLFRSDKKMIRFLQTPGPLTKYLLGGILLLICVSMVWYLVPSSGSSGISYNFGGFGKGVVAQVDGNDISSDDVRQTAKLMLQQQMPQGGPNVGMLLPFFAQRAAEQLITRQALVAEATHMGLHVTPEEVKDE